MHFYGAACRRAQKAEVIAAAMRQLFPNAKAHVTEDLLAAARALLGREPGFAAILGTGTNSCLYDGEKITYNVDSLGYFLGDEGSGSYIGKRLLRDYLRGLLPDGLQEVFQGNLRRWARATTFWTGSTTSPCPTASWPASPSLPTTTTT